MKDGQPPADPGSSARARIRQQSAAVLAIGVREGLDGGVGVRVPVDIEARVQLDLVRVTGRGRVRGRVRVRVRVGLLEPFAATGSRVVG